MKQGYYTESQRDRKGNQRAWVNKTGMQNRNQLYRPASCEESKGKRRRENNPEKRAAISHHCCPPRITSHHVTFKTPKKSRSLSRSCPPVFFPFRGLITTSPQCFGTAPRSPAADWRVASGVSAAVVVIFTGAPSWLSGRDVDGDTEPRRVARGCKCGCGWRDQISMTDLSRPVSHCLPSGHGHIGG